MFDTAFERSHPPNYRKPHVFDPIHNGADECECGLTSDADTHVTTTKPQSTTEALSPCPFCGSVDLDLSNGYDEDANWVVVCRGCKSSGTFCVEKSKAITRWNTRTANDLAGKAVAEWFKTDFISALNPRLDRLLARLKSRPRPPASAAPVVDNFEAWIKNYWPDWRKAESAPIELMRAAWDAATRLANFNELALKGAIDYTVELETKLAATAEQPNQLTDLQRAMIDHDDDMARLDRNTMAVTSPAAATAAPVGDDNELRFALEGMVAAFDGECSVDPSITATTRECAISVAKQALGWSAAPVEQSETCEWEDNGRGFWLASCGDAFKVYDNDINVTGMHFCPFCGKPIKPKDRANEGAR